MKTLFKFTYSGSYKYFTIYKDDNWFITLDNPWVVPGSFNLYYGKGNYTTCFSWLGLTILYDNGKLG